MAWAIGFDTKWGRDIGYGVPAYCDQPGCGERIDRGLAYVCGAEPYGGERGCGLYFCGGHQHGGEQLCERCLRGDGPFQPTPDHPDWTRHKLTDPSWEQWVLVEQLQLTTRPKTKNPLLRLLGLVLHIANSRPPILGTKTFYELKSELTRRFGTPDGYDIQHIQKTCHGCNGTGIYRHAYLGRVSCNRCWDGLYKDSLIKLDRWRLGAHTFHCPVDRIEHASRRLTSPWWLPENGGKPRAEIEGYVEHRSHLGHWPSECAYWLFLIFRPKVFAELIGHCGHSRPRSPLVFIGSVLFWYRMQVSRMEQWHFNPYDSEGRWKQTLFGTCQVFEMETLGDRLALKRRRRNGAEDEIPF